MSKGSKPRPIKNRDEFNDNWDRIFKKKENLDILVTLLYSRRSTYRCGIWGTL